LLCDETSQASPAGFADVKIGDVPSPIITIASGAKWVVVKPLAAEIAPATMRLARTPRNAFFTIELSLPEVATTQAKNALTRYLRAVVRLYCLNLKEAVWMQLAKDFVKVNDLA